MAKPAGPLCNLQCKYCFYLEKKELFQSDCFKMSELVLKTYIKQYLQYHPDGPVEIAWQGGEPTLRNVDFYKKAVSIAKLYCRENQTLKFSMQTNGMGIDEQWCRFFKKHNVLVGLSIDGPKKIHDANRITRSGDGSFNQVSKTVLRSICLSRRVS